MKQRIVPGGELDIPSLDEIREVVRSRDQRVTRGKIRDVATGRTTAAGAATIKLYTCPTGMQFALHRLVVEAAGFTPGVPFNAAGAYLLLQRQGHTEDFLSLVAGAAGGGSLPAVFTAGEADGPLIANGEFFELVVVAGPATTDITCQVQGTLGPLTLA